MDGNCRLWFQSALLPGGAAESVRIEAEAGRISAIEVGVSAQAGDERGGLGVPGLPNLHSHAFQRAMAGLAEVRGPSGDSFWTWRELMYRFLDRLDPDALEAVAAQAFMEMLEAGFTRVGEFHYVHHDADGATFENPAEMATRIGAAAGKTGIGLTLLPVFYAHAGFSGAPPTEGQRRFIHSVDSYGRLLEASRAAVRSLPDAVVGVAPHSLRAVTEAELIEVARLAGGAPIHIHIAEQTKEVDDCLAWSGRRPVEWLLDHAEVGDSWCLVHATHMTPEEIRRMAERRAVAGLCPITEANLGDGVFPAEAFLAAGGVFGVGSDSNVLIDAAEELRMLEYSQRLTRRARNVLASGPGVSTGRTLFEGAVAGGARALGVEAGLRVGAPADVVSLDREAPALAGRGLDAALDSWIFAGSRTLVDGVWRAGRKVVANGRHHLRDQVSQRYRRVLEGLLA
jgi:formiminoglutamate deiminase